MIKIENLEVFSLKGAICGMRNPYDSWGKSDSSICKTLYKLYDGTEIMTDDGIKIGEKDLELRRVLKEHSERINEIAALLKIHSIGIRTTKERGRRKRWINFATRIFI